MRVENNLNRKGNEIKREEHIKKEKEKEKKVKIETRRKKKEKKK